jgi:hypothetical protein
MSRFGPVATCDSCGSEAADLVEVRRLYVTPESWDTEGRTEVAPDAERWCFPCRTHYPHLVGSEPA